LQNFYKQPVYLSQRSPRNSRTNNPIVAEAKLASNISISRNAAGVQWRTDYTESVKLGEAIAIGILEEQKATYNEDHYFTLTKFDSTAIVI